MHDGHNFVCVQEFEIRRLRLIHKKCVDSRSKVYVTTFKQF